MQDWRGWAQEGVDEGRQLLPGEQGGAVLKEEHQGQGGRSVQREEERPWGRDRLLSWLRRRGLGLVQVRWHVVWQVGVECWLGCHWVQGWID